MVLRLAGVWYHYPVGDSSVRADGGGGKLERAGAGQGPGGDKGGDHEPEPASNLLHVKAWGWVSSHGSPQEPDVD